MDTNFEESFDLKKELFYYLRYWYYFLLCVVLALLSAHIYLRYKNPTYAIETTIKILDESKNGLKLPSELLGMMASKSGLNLENEIEVLKSRRLFAPVVSELNLTSFYFSKGKFKNNEVWQGPVKVTSLAHPDSLFAPLELNIEFKNNGYLITPAGGKKIFLKGIYAKTTINSFGIEIEPNLNSNKKLTNYQTYVTILPFKTAVEVLKSKINVSKVGDESEILSIKLLETNKTKGIDILNKIVEVFNQDGINDRRIVNEKTVNFIDERFLNLTEELDSIENKKSDFKKSKQMSFLEVDALVEVNNKSVSNNTLFSIETQIELSKLLKEALESNKTTILPSNIGLDNVIINELINEYNTLILQRERLLRTAGNENPTLKRLESQLSILKNNINESIITYSSQLKISLTQQENNNAELSNDVLAIPTNEKILRSIEREQKIKENLYLLLLQKREESAIAYAVTSPSIKIIEYGNSSQAPVSPKKNTLYLIALVIGIALPFSTLYIINLLDTKIKDSNDYAFKKSTIPIIGELPLFKDFKLFEDKNDRSVHAESFRLLSSNVTFSLPLKENGLGQVLLVTSSIMGEGKTFIASNLALALSSYDKKVLLVGADLRKPKLEKALNIEKSIDGLSTYLHSSDKNWKDLLVTDNPYNKNLSILFSGPNPPNPSTIISNGRMELLIKESKQEYDFIIIDTAPTIYVNDTLLIAHLADLTLYITKHNYTEKKLIEYATTLNETSKLNNIVFVLNGINLNHSSSYNYSYKYSYNYSYEEDEERNEKQTFIKTITTYFFKLLKHYNLKK